MTAARKAAGSAASTRRGGSDGPNYEEEHVAAACAVLTKGKLRPSLIVDCSHGNSRKIHTNQPLVAADVAKRVAAGDTKVSGIMLESFLCAGRQDIPKPTTSKAGGAPALGFGGLQPSLQLASMKYGCSVTDACMDWDMTQKVLDDLAAAVRARRG